MLYFCNPNQNFLEKLSKVKINIKRLKGTYSVTLKIEINHLF